MNFEGQNISLKDALFVDNITGDLENFRIRSSSIARVLVFPPVNNYHRFLIHKVVETGFPQFTTFSVGEGLERRTVVCFQQHLLEVTLNQTKDYGLSLVDKPAESSEGSAEQGGTLSEMVETKVETKVETNGQGELTERQETCQHGQDNSKSVNGNLDFTVREYTVKVGSLDGEDLTKIESSSLEEEAEEEETKCPEDKVDCNRSAVEDIRSAVEDNRPTVEDKRSDVEVYRSAVEDIGSSATEDSEHLNAAAVPEDEGSGSNNGETLAQNNNSREIKEDDIEIVEIKINGESNDIALKCEEENTSRRRSKRPAKAVYVPPRGRNSTPGSGAKPPPTLPNSDSRAKTPPTLAISVQIEQVKPKLALLNSDLINEKPVVAEGIDVTEQVVKEITLAVGGVQIEAPEVNYLEFQTSDSTINIDQFGHVIELYDFPAEFKTTDLVNAFHAFTSRWDIKWVDDTHALGVFSSPEIAAEALAVRHPLILTRPLNMATLQSKSKARSVLEELLPYKPRPFSCTAPARRLLQAALGSGMRLPEASSVETERLREAMQRKEEGKRRDGASMEDRKKRREEALNPMIEKKYRHDEHDHR